MSDYICVKNVMYRVGLGHTNRAIFTALHWMQRSSYEKAVCPSVCLSNAWIVTKRKRDLSRCLYHTKDHLA